MNNQENSPPSKAQIIASSYYSRKDIQQAMFEFCKHRETIGNFNNKFFAKRPDTFDYPSDILNQAKRGVTSFHTSEEIWTNPLDINTDMTPEQYNQIRTGWDLLIDIDSPFLDYGKIAAKLIIKELESHGVKNFGIKFSGGKGFHLIIPFKAFPEQVGEEQTKDNFPEWPRLIAGYISQRIKDPMNDEMIKLSGEDKLIEIGELTIEKICPKCKNPVKEKVFYKYKCPSFKCKHEQESPIKKKSNFCCPECNSKMEMVGERKTDFCKECKISTIAIEIKREKVRFKEDKSTKSHEDSVDVILVSSRHLFRAPYSLHEKSAFASIVLSKDEIEDFKPTDADPLKITEPKSFMPNCEPEEARGLLLEALDWGKRNVPKEQPKKYEGGSIDIQGLSITEDMFPPIIKKLLKGIKTDGRKRALGLLLSFFTSLEFPQDFIEEKISQWNKKNYQPLKDNYIKPQIAWSIKNKRLPPNYDKPIYKEFGINAPPEPGMKNPINYTIKKAMQAKNKSKDFYVKEKPSKEI